MNLRHLSESTDPAACSVQVMRDLAQRPCILFDYDGTLGNTTQSIVATARMVLSDFGMSEEEMGDLRRLIGPPFPQAYSEVYGLSEKDAATVTAHYRKLYDVCGPEAWPPFAGIPELLAQLQANGRHLAVASSKRQGLLERCVSDGKIADYFEAIEGKKIDTNKQTKADTIQAAIDKLGFTAEQTVMVGDRHYDVEAAKQVGLPCIGVYFGDTAPAGELEEAGAIAVVHSVDQLGRILCGI